MLPCSSAPLLYAPAERHGPHLSDAVREPATPYASEAELSAIWAGQLFARRWLRTEDGEALRVVYRGLPGAGPGPDFRGAIVVGPDGPRHGDVELHVRESDFRRHGHEADAAYANVVPHVVFEAEGAADTALCGGGRAPLFVVPLPSERSKVRDPRRAWAEPCATALPRLGGEACGAALDRLGEMRFRQKTQAVRRRLAEGGEDELLWAGLLEGLGYGGLRELFHETVLGLPWLRLRAEMLSGTERERAPIAYLLLSEALRAVPVAGPLRTRPGNGLEDRLRGAAALAARFSVNGPVRALLPLVELPSGRAVAALIEALSVPKLVGRSRAVELATNAVLPLAAALAGSPGEEARVEAVYAAVPSPARYGSVRHLARALAGLPHSARRGQGMLYLLKQYCTQGGCGRCPLS